MNYADIISNSNIFNGISSNEVTELLNMVHHTIGHLKKDDILAMQGELCNRLIILIEGKVKAEMTDPSGKVVKVEDITAPSPLAILFLFGKENRFPVQVTALEKVTALTLPKESVIKLLQKNELFLVNYLNISAHYASTLTKKLYILSFRTIRQKLASYFLDLTKPNLSEAQLDRTQLALSEYFGVSRPSLARELGHMQTDGLIRLSNKRIEILNRNKLIQLVTF